jgi:hypothetical protein
MAKGIRVERELKKLIPCFLSSNWGYFGENGIKYLQEGIGFPSSPSDTHPIHIFLKQKLGNIVRSNTSTIKDSDLPGHWLPKSICDFVPDDSVSLLGLPWRCRFLCADSPIGFVEDLAPGYFIGMKILKDDIHLLLDGDRSLA